MEIKQTTSDKSRKNSSLIWWIISSPSFWLLTFAFAIVIYDICHTFNLPSLYLLRYPFELTIVSVTGAVAIMFLHFVINLLKYSKKDNALQKDQESVWIRIAFNVFRIASVTIIPLYWILLNPNFSIRGLMLHGGIGLIATLYAWLNGIGIPKPGRNLGEDRGKSEKFYYYLCFLALLGLIYTGWSSIGQFFFVHGPIYPAVLNWKHVFDAMMAVTAGVGSFWFFALILALLDTIIRRLKWFSSQLTSNDLSSPSLSEDEKL